VYDIDTLEGSREPVGVAFTPYLSIGDDVETCLLLRPNRQDRCVVLGFGQDGACEGRGWVEPPGVLAWLWTRYQPGAAQVCWFRERVGYGTAGAAFQNVKFAVAPPLTNPLATTVGPWLDR
jgi:hypothetical protein